MQKKTMNIVLTNILTGYLFLMFCIYPFYFEDGYYNISDAKNKFYDVVSIATFVIIMIVVIAGFGYKKKNKFFIDRRNISITQKLLLGYMAVIIVSFLLSNYKNIVLWGAEGWLLGTIPLLLMGSFVFFLAYFWREQKWIWLGSISVSGLVFLLGICNRFSFYPVYIEPQNPAFISTLGNINWFCGYMSVLAPIGIGLFMLKENSEYRRPIEKWLLILYIYIVFIAGFCQGSSSVFLWNGGMFAVLLGIALEKSSRIKRWMLVIGLWGVSGQTVRLLRYLWPESYNYESGMFVDTNITLFIIIATGIAYAILSVFVKKDVELSAILKKRLRTVLVIVIILGALSVGVLSVYNTNIGLPFLKDNELFLLNENWGNGRGAAIKTAFDLFEKMSITQKLFGVGPDGFCAFAYSFPEIREYLVAFFGDSLLTNAHCEIITNIINLGILGGTLYIAVLFSFIYRALKSGENQPMLYILAVCIICYLVNNLISFAQILNLPFVFLLIGVGEYYLIEENKV